MVTPAQHAAHTSMRQSLLGKMGIKMPNLSDMRLNKSGTVGTEPIAKPNGRGGFNKFTELKFGGLGKFDIPNNKIS